MKKLVLTLAMVLISVGVFAQTNMVANKIDKEALLSKQASTALMSKVIQSPIKKSYAENTYPLCDFSDATAYTFGTTDKHTSLVEFELLNTDLDINTWWTLRYWRSSPGTTPADFATWVDGFEPNANPWIPMDITNGFAGINQTQQQATEFIEAYVKLNNPITTNGRSLDIHFVQVLASLHNYDQYFLDWSTDPNFAVGSYDSVAFNIKNIDGVTGDYYGSSALYGRKVVNIPTGTSICNIATTGQQIYVRFRLCNLTASQYNGGYQWFLDNISYAWAPDNRIEILSYYIADGYRKVPSILEPESFRSVATIQNTGSADATNVRLVNQFYSVAQAGDTPVFTKITEGTSDTLATMKNEIYADTVRNAVGTIIAIDHIRYHQMIVSDYAVSQPGNEVAGYAYTADVMYTINGEEQAENLDTSYYYIAGEDGARSHCYTWQKDIGVLYEGASGVWNYYYPTSTSYGQGTEPSTDGYRLCIAYTKYTNKINTPVYAAGVEVVPGLDSCEAGAVIRASLWKLNAYATTMDERIIEVTDASNNPLVSEEHVVATAELNNNATPGYSADDPREVFHEGNYNTIFMPFTYDEYALEDSSTYYACYTKVGSNGKFYVAKDPDALNSYSYGSIWSILIWSPSLAGSQTQYDWGYVWSTQNYSKGSVPAIRLIVSDIANSSINNVATEATSSMVAYPNPAADRVTLSYTLNQSGNVNITVTDIMGRVVLMENQGKKEAGFAYKTSINTSNMNNGTYFYTVEVNGVKSTDKLVVNR